MEYVRSKRLERVTKEPIPYSTLEYDLILRNVQPVQNVTSIVPLRPVRIPRNAMSPGLISESIALSVKLPWLVPTVNVSAPTGLTAYRRATFIMGRPLRKK